MKHLVSFRSGSRASIRIEGNSRILVASTEERLLSISTVGVYVFGLTNIVLLCGSGICSLFCLRPNRSTLIFMHRICDIMTRYGVSVIEKFLVKISFYSYFKVCFRKLICVYFIANFILSLIIYIKQFHYKIFVYLKYKSEKNLSFFSITFTYENTIRKY